MREHVFGISKVVATECYLSVGISIPYSLYLLFFFFITLVYFEGCLTKDYSSNGAVQM